jgi:hypothetical protein
MFRLCRFRTGFHFSPIETKYNIGDQVLEIENNGLRYRKGFQRFVYAAT